MWNKQKLIGLSIASIIVLGPMITGLSYLNDGHLIPADYTGAKMVGYLIGYFAGIFLLLPAFGLAWAASATVVWHAFNGHIIVASFVSLILIGTLWFSMPLDGVIVVLYMPAVGGLIHGVWRLLRMLNLAPAEPLDHAPLQAVFE